MPPQDRPTRLIPVYMDDVRGREFEKLCQKIFDLLEYGEVELTPETNDGGKDLIIQKGGYKILVECRHEPGINQGSSDLYMAPWLMRGLRVVSLLPRVVSLKTQRKRRRNMFLRSTHGTRRDNGTGEGGRVPINLSGG